MPYEVCDELCILISHPMLTGWYHQQTERSVFSVRLRRQLWTCPTCKETMESSLADLHELTTTHLAKLPWTCDQCKRTMPTSHREYHLSTELHALSQPWSCPICGEILTGVTQYRHRCAKADVVGLTRILEERQDVPYSTEWICTTCATALPISHREKHLSSKSHANNLPWTCRACNHTTTIGLRKSHITSKHPKQTFTVSKFAMQAAFVKSGGMVRYLTPRTCKTCGKTRETGCLHVYGGSQLGWLGP